MNLSIFLFFFCVVVRGSKYQTHKKTNGFDYRPDITESPSQLYRIAKYFEKKRLLNALENPRIPIHVKLSLLPKPGIQPPNIFAGGLMKDFLFDMEDLPPLNKN
jgi:hypothetical protein